MSQAVGNGFLFDCRTVGGRTGVVCEYRPSVMERGLVRVIVGVDSGGRVVMPVWLSGSFGFQSIGDTEEEVARFFRGNRPYYVMLGSFALLVSGVVEFTERGADFHGDGSPLYVPKSVTEGGLLCERLGTSPGVNTFVVNERAYNAYRRNFLRQIGGCKWGSKTEFFTSLLVGDSNV